MSDSRLNAKIVAAWARRHPALFVEVAAEVLGLGVEDRDHSDETRLYWDEQGIILFDKGDTPRGPWIHFHSDREERFRKALEIAEGT